MGETGLIPTEETKVVMILIFFFAMFLVFIGTIFIFIREYRIKKKAHIQELETIDLLHKKELLKTQVEIQLQTMKYIGREIHDNIGQKLTLSSLYLEQLAFENKAPDIHKNIHDINNIINESLQELRQLSKSLTDDTIESHSISELLENECKKIKNLKKCSVSFVNDIEHVQESYQIKSIVLRIAQEFLQNSIKHANCKNIFVSLSNGEKSLELVLQDDGKGFNVDNVQTKGIGLKNIKKRIELIHGTYKLESEHTIGTTLTIKIPI